jgi:hypothetical protein
VSSAEYSQFTTMYTVYKKLFVVRISML